MKKGKLVILMLTVAAMASCGNGQQAKSAEQALEDSLRQDSIMKVEAAAQAKADSIRQDSIITATAFKGTFKSKNGDLGEIKIDLYEPTVKCVVYYAYDPEDESIEHAMGNVSIGSNMLFYAKGHMGDFEKKVRPVKIDGRKATFGVASACDALWANLELTYVEGNKYKLRALGESPFFDVNNGKWLPKEIELEKIK